MRCKQFAWTAAFAVLGGIASAGAAPEGRATTANNAPTGAEAPAGDHMNGAFHREMVSIFVLPEMQPELGLSAQQVAALRRLKQDLVAKSKDISGQISARRKELDALLSEDTSRTRTVKTLFEQIANLHAQLQYAGFDTANKMKAALTSEQRTKFHAMQPMDLHRVMISRGNMAEIEETMQRMGAEEGMGSHRETMHDAMPHDSPHDSHGTHHGGANGSSPRGPAS